MNRHDKSRARPQAVPHRIALAAALAALAPLGQAQTASSSTPETVVVTGVRRAAESAQTIKRESDQVVDAIVAEDIGKFPDKNVAEILGRVTGVQILRGNGEAGTVIVRGLGGVATLLNGREFFSDSGRSLYLADVPTTMLKGLSVYKSQGADLPEGGTAGVIDVRTHRPFDFNGRQVVVNARNEHRDKAGTDNPDLSGMASDRWVTSAGEFGLLGGLSFQNGKYHDERAWMGDPEIRNNVLSSCCVGRVLDLGDRERLAVNFAAQWRPKAEMEFFAEGFHTKIDHRYQQSFLVAGIPDPGLSNTVVTVKPGTNNLDTTYNTNYNGWGFTSTQAKHDEAQNTQLATGLRWDLNSKLRLNTELALTNSKIDWVNRILDTYYEPHNTIVKVQDGGGYVDYPGMDLTNPANFKIGGGVDVRGMRKGKATDWRADLIFTPESGFIEELAGGVRLAKRHAESINTSQPWQDAGPNDNQLVTNFPGITEASPATWGNFGVKSYTFASRDWLLNNGAEFRKLITGSTAETPYDPMTHFDDVENTRALYGKAKFAFDVQGIRLSGVAGLRWVNTSQTLKGFTSTGGVITPETRDTSRSDLLPSLSLKAMFTPQLIGRLVAGKTIERPAFNDYNPGLFLTPPNANQTKGTGSAGNPDLKPTESTNVDVALEWYFAKTGSLTATVFDHRFKNRLATDFKDEVINGTTYVVSRLYNLNTANLHGFEVSYRQFYDRLPGWLSGFGLEANYTQMSGKQKSAQGVETIFLGQSKHAANLVGLYERNDLYGRLAYNWRSKFLAEYPYRTTGRELWVAALSTLDMSVGYHVNKNLTVSVDVTNLLNQAYHDYFDKNPAMVRDVRYYDRNIGLALRWKL